MSKTALQRITEMKPAFDRRHADPAKNYGIHGVELRMVLKGGHGAVQFVVYTNWHLPDVERELWTRRHDSDYNPFAPMGADVGYHSPVPRYEGQEPMSSRCPYIDGRSCYYDGSALQADEMLQLLIAEGSDTVWARLEEQYDRLFGQSDTSQP